MSVTQKGWPTNKQIAALIRKEEAAVLRDVGKFVRSKAAKYPEQSSGTSYRRTGTLGRSISMSEPATTGSKMWIAVGTNKHYARYVEEGTGLYGPKHAKIVPKSAKALRWTAMAGRMYGVTGGKIGPSALNVGIALVAMGVGRSKGKLTAVRSKDVYAMFARSVRGMHAWHYMEKAIKDPETIAYFQARGKMMFARLEAALKAAGSGTVGG